MNTDLTSFPMKLFLQQRPMLDLVKFVLNTAGVCMKPGGYYPLNGPCLIENWDIASSDVLERVHTHFLFY